MTNESDEMITSRPIDDEKSGAARTRGRRPLAGLGGFVARPLVLPVLALVLAVVLAALVVVNQRQTAEDEVRADVPKVLAASVAKLLSYTPTTVASDLATEKEWLTGDFLDEYSTLVTKTVAPAAVKGKVTVNATVVARGVQSVSGDRIEVLMFVNVATTRAGAKTPQSQGSRVRVVAEKVDGAWLISSLSPV